MITYYFKRHKWTVMKSRKIAFHPVHKASPEAAYKGKDKGKSGETEKSDKPKK